MKKGTGFQQWQISPELVAATEAAVRAGAEENARRREKDAPRPPRYVERLLEDLWRDQNDAFFDKNLRALKAFIEETGWYPVVTDLALLWRPGNSARPPVSTPRRATR